MIIFKKIDEFIDKYYVWLFVFLAFVLVRKTFLLYFDDTLNVVYEDLTLFTNFAEYKHFLLGSFNEYYSVSSVRSLYYYVFLIGRLKCFFPIFILLVISGLGISFYFSSKKIISIITGKNYKGLSFFVISFLYLLYFFITKGHHFYHVLPGAILFPIQLWLLLELSSVKKNFKHIFEQPKLYLFLILILLGGNIHHLIILIALVWLSALFINKQMFFVGILSVLMLLVVLYPSYIAGNATETTPITLSFQEYAGSVSSFLINPFERILPTETITSYTKETISFYVFFFCFVLGYLSILLKREIKNKKVFYYLYSILILTSILSFGLTFELYHHIYNILLIPIASNLFSIWLSIFRFPTRFMLVAIPICLILSLLVINKYKGIKYLIVAFVLLQIIFVQPVNMLFQGDLGGKYNPTTFEKINDLPKDSRVIYYPSFTNASLNEKWITQEFLILNNGYFSIETSNTGGTEFNMKYAMLPYYLVQKDKVNNELNAYYENFGVDYIIIYKKILLKQDGLRVTPEFLRVFQQSDLELVKSNEDYEIYKINYLCKELDIYYGNLLEYWDNELYKTNKIFFHESLFIKNKNRLNLDNLHLVPEKQQLSLSDLYKIFGEDFLSIRQANTPACYKNLELCLRKNDMTLILNSEQFAVATKYIKSLNSNNKIDYFVDDNKYYLNYYYNELAIPDINQKDHNITIKYLIIAILLLMLIHYYIVSKRKSIIISGIDGSGKTTIAKKLQKNGYGRYIHYYNLVPVRSNNNSRSDSKEKDPHWLIAFTKEFIYSIFKFFHLVIKNYKENIIVDRIYIDVYIDLSVKHGNHLIFNIFKILQLLLDLTVFPFAKKIQLILNQPEIIVSRKEDEDMSSAKEKIYLYKKNSYGYRSHFKIDSHVNSANQVFLKTVKHVEK